MRMIFASTTSANPAPTTARFSLPMSTLSGGSGVARNPAEVEHGRSRATDALEAGRDLTVGARVAGRTATIAALSRPSAIPPKTQRFTGHGGGQRREGGGGSVRRVRFARGRQDAPPPGRRAGGAARLVRARHGRRVRPEGGGARPPAWTEAALGGEDRGTPRSHPARQGSAPLL